MKRFITITLLVLVAIASCKKFDDSKIWDKLNEYESRIAYLEELCKHLNADIINLQTIITALETNDYIVSASPLATGDGYTFIFKSGKSIVIYNGENGTDGVTPIISIKKDLDGQYYWTINGEWLLVEGEKVKASSQDGKDGINGKDGITPELKIEDDYWYISYDNGVNWEQLGKATGKDGMLIGEDDGNIFTSVTEDKKNVYFHLTDGTIITLPKYYPDIIHFQDLIVKSICCRYWDTNVDGELSYAEAAAVSSIGTIFEGNKNIASFDELQYFTGLKTIPECAFKRCDNLWKVTLPESITEIGSESFFGCPLSFINIPDNVETIGDLAFTKYSSSFLLKITLGKNLRTIGRESFNGSDKLTELNLSPDLETIESLAFSNCTNLNILHIGNVQKIEYMAFAYSGLKEVYISSLTPPTLDKGTANNVSIFYGNTNDFIIYVPREALDVYKADKNWNTLAEIQPYDF